MPRLASPTIHKSPRSLYTAYDRHKMDNTKEDLTAAATNRKVHPDVHLYEPISPASSSDNEGGTSPLPTRCDYVKVIVSTKGDNSKGGGGKGGGVDPKTADVGVRAASPSSATFDPDFVTLSIERIFTDSYLQQAWEKCQYIDLFLYSSMPTTEVTPHLQPLIPAHRILLSAYSDYVRQFTKSYPEPVKFVEQLQTFLREITATRASQTPSSGSAKIEEQIELNELNLKALGMSSIPVLVFSIPLADLHDLVKLMYRGEVNIEKGRISSLQKSAQKLKMSSIAIVETNEQLLDSNGNYPETASHLNGHQHHHHHHNCNRSCSCCRSSKSTLNNSQEPVETETQPPAAAATAATTSCDLESVISTTETSSTLSQDGGSFGDPISPKVILVDDTSSQEEAALLRSPKSNASTKRSLAAFLRETSTPTLSIPKMSRQDTVVRNAFDRPQPAAMMHHNLADAFVSDRPGSGFFDLHHALLHSKSFPQLITRSQSLNEMNHHQNRLMRTVLPESPLIAQLKRKEPTITPIPPPTPSATTTLLNPFQNFNSGILPSNLLTPPIDSPTIEGHLKSLLPQSPNKLMLPSLGSPSSLAPFLFSKNPFDAGPPAFHSPFPAFPGLGTGSSGMGIQRQFSAPANLQTSSSSFSGNHHHHHQAHDLSPLIFDGHTASQNSELVKSRRGRKPANYIPSSEPNSPGIGFFPDGSQGLFGSAMSDRSDSPKSDSHQCGANGWLTTAGSGANCRKRCQNLYHAAKYRDRRRQRMEQLYGEKDVLEKAQNIYLSKISTLKMQICSLVTQRTQQQTRNGQVTYRCPVCRSVFIDVEVIRAHLTKEHHKDYQNMTKATAAAVAASAVTTIEHPDIAQQIRSLTKDWLQRSAVTNLHRSESQTEPNTGPHNKNPNPAHFSPHLSNGLNALPMIPFS